MNWEMHTDGLSLVFKREDKKCCIFEVFDKNLSSKWVLTDLCTDDSTIFSELKEAIKASHKIK